MWECPYCGLCTMPAHGPERCSMVEEIEYFANGNVKRIKKRDWFNPVTPAPQITSTPHIPPPHVFSVTTVGYPNSNPISAHTTW